MLVISYFNLLFLESPITYQTTNVMIVTARYFIQVLFVVNMLQSIGMVDKSVLNNILKQISATITEIKIGKITMRKYENEGKLVRYSSERLSNSFRISTKTKSMTNGKKSKNLLVL